MLRRILSLGGTLIVAQTLFAQTVLNESNSAGLGSLEEVMITARKRNESLQTTPLSVTAIGAPEMEGRSAGRFSELSQSIPSLSVQSVASNVGGSASDAIYIRGIGSNEVGIGSEPGVGIFLDGVPQSRFQQIDIDLLGVRRVEVLRGPQGTLYGKNTIGGAINFVTFEPDVTSSHVQFQAITGSYHRVDGLLSANLPIGAGRWAVRLDAGSRNDEGYGQRLDAGDRMANHHNVSARLSTLWVPNESWQALLRVDGTQASSHNADFRLASVGTPALVQVYNGFFNLPYDSRWITNAPWSSFATGPNKDDEDGWSTNLTVTWHGPGADVKSITAYQDHRTAVDLDPDGSPIDVLSTYSNIDQHQISEELQVSSTTFNARLAWVTEVFFVHEVARQVQSADVFPLLEPIIGDLGFRQHDSTHNYEYSVSQRFNYAWTESIHTTFGLRATHEDKQAEFDQLALHTGIIESPLLNESASFNNVSPQVGVDYQYTPNLMSYVSFARGFKSGGFNNSGVGAANTFAPESASTYEFGFRSDWWQHRARVNATAFFTRYANIQVSESYATPGGQPLALIANAARARIDGGEFEFAAVPIPNCSLSLTAGYTDARYTSSANTSGQGLPPVTSQTPFVNTPKWTAGASAQYDAIITSHLKVTPRVDSNYHSRTYHDISGTALTTQPGYVLFNARLTMGAADDQWSVSVFGTNLLNKYYRIGGTDFRDSLGFATVLVGPPREWGLQARFRLGERQ